MLVVDSDFSSIDAAIKTYQRCLDLETSHADVLVSTHPATWLASHAHHLVLADRSVPSPSDRADTFRSCEHVDELLSEVQANHRGADAAGQLGDEIAHRLASMALRSPSVSVITASGEPVAERLSDLAPGRNIFLCPPETNLVSLDSSFLPTTPRYVTVADASPQTLTELVADAFGTITDPAARLRISDVFDAGRSRPGTEALQRVAADDHRIELLDRLDGDALAAEFAGASAVVVARAADHFDTVALEAMRQGTPVVATTTSSAGTELVEHGVNGVVMEPTANSLSWGMRHVTSSARVRWDLGLQARRRGHASTLDPLVDVIEDMIAATDRPLAVMLSTYALEPVIGGGQRRARHLSRALADRCDVTVIVSSPSIEGVRHRLLEVGLSQVEVGRSAAQREAEIDLFHALGAIPVDDITASTLSKATPALAETIEHHLNRAAVIIGIQPFLLPVVPPTDVPTVYDSQNAEAALKAELLPDSRGGAWLLDRALAAETAATRRADLITACTEADLEQIRTLSDRSIDGVVVGNGVDAAAMPMKTDEQAKFARDELLALAGANSSDDRPLALFIGSWHPPNILAARLILELAEQRPDWIFLLAGSHTSEFADETIPTNVHMIAIFAEPLLWPLIAGVDVALNPMNSGGGSNLKIFDYLSVGTPVLSTSFGARGIKEPSRYATIAEPTADGFSAGLDAAMRSGGTVRQRVAAGRQLVEASFDWSTLGAVWADAIITTAGLDVPELRERTRVHSEPILSHRTPPSSDPVVATMEMLGQNAVLLPPSPLESTLDPTIREHLLHAENHRHVGRHLPSSARFPFVKRLIIRVGQALSNEQAVYNEANLDAVRHLALKNQALEDELRRVRGELDALANENRSTLRRLKALE